MMRGGWSVAISWRTESLVRVHPDDLYVGTAGDGVNDWPD
jgi:hypothetical protein